MATIKKQQTVMHHAHILYRHMQELSIISNVHPDWGGAVHQAWKIQDVRKALQQGAVKLTYCKANGEYVYRIGTLNPDFIPGSRMPQGIQQANIEAGLEQPVWSTVSYYDLTKQGWRSFSVTNLVSVEKVALTLMPNCVFTGELVY